MLRRSSSRSRNRDTGRESMLVRRAAPRLGAAGRGVRRGRGRARHRGRGRRAAARPGTGRHQSAGRDHRAGRRRRRPAARHLAGDPRRARAAGPTPGLPAGADDPAAFAAVVAGGPPTTTDRQVDGVTYRVTTVRRTDGFVVQAVLDLTPRQTTESGSSPRCSPPARSGLLLAAAAGRWLSRRALQPMSAALALQRRFVADAGHELRTPLTLLGTRAQLLRRRLQQVRDGRRHPGRGPTPAPSRSRRSPTGPWTTSTASSPTARTSPPSSKTCCWPPTRTWPARSGSST